MKKCLLTLFCILPAIGLYAQKIEVTVQANSGLFKYSGQSATNSSYLNQTPDGKTNYTNNPYGNENALSYGFSVQTQLVLKSGFLFGLQAGYDVLRSKVNLTGIYIYNYQYYYFLPFTSAVAYYTPPPTGNGTGATYLQDQFINLSPYIGYRLHIKNVSLDVLPGMDIGLNISSYDKGKLTITDEFNYAGPPPLFTSVMVNKGAVYQTDYKLPDAPKDIRLKLGLAATYKRFGITASYARGLTNYEKNMDSDGNNYNAESRLFRFGINYRIF